MRGLPGSLFYELRHGHGHIVMVAEATLLQMAAQSISPRMYNAMPPI